MRIEEARKILWKSCNALTDEEIQKLVDYIWSICSFVLECYIQEKFKEIT